MRYQRHSHPKESSSAQSPGSKHGLSLPAVPVLQHKTAAEELQMKTASTVSSSLPVVQRLKWTRVANRLKVYNESDGSVRAPGEDEELSASIGTNEWRPGAVWDDDAGKWLEVSESGLVDRKENMVFSPVNVAKYDEGTDKNFGHRFDFSVWMKADSIKWWEKTEKPYVDTMEPNAWTDMYAAYKSTSAVFAGAKNIGPKYQAYTFNDPPGILREPNNKRLLEFKLEFEDNAAQKGLITAKQELATDAEGEIAKQEFEILSQSVT